MAESVPAVSEVLSEQRREQGVDLLRHLIANGSLDLSGFDRALEQILSARTEGDFAAVVNGLPPAFRLTPSERRLDEPLVIQALTQNIKMDGRWQVARHTTVRSKTGTIRIDLTEAEFDDRVINLSIEVVTGNTTVIVPRGVAVQLVGTTAATRMDLAPPLPGYPLIRLSTKSVTGRIRVRNPKERRRRFWRRRRN